MKSLIQDLINWGDVNIKDHPINSTNNDFGIYKDPIPKHGKKNDFGKGKSYNNVSYSYHYVVGHIEETNNHIATITFPNKTHECAVITWHIKVTL